MSATKMLSSLFICILGVLALLVVYGLCYLAFAK